MTPEQVVAGVREGRRRAIGRAITMAESLGPEGRGVVRALYPQAGRAMRVGITGSPGAGKSTLSAALVRLLRARGMTVAIVSVDPTSPFTHGAVLGDRIRLVDHFLDDGVFIRSMASRGHLGGLSEATGDAVTILDAAGFDVVIDAIDDVDHKFFFLGGLAEAIGGKCSAGTRSEDHTSLGPMCHAHNVLHQIDGQLTTSLSLRTDVTRQ